MNDASLDDDAKPKLRHSVITITIPAAIMILVGILIAFSLGFWRLQSIGHDALVRDRATNARATYINCVAIGQEKTELQAVVDAAFKSSTATVDITVLPAKTQELLAEVAPYFRLLASATGDRGAAVKAVIKPAPACHKPPPPDGEPVVEETTTTSTSTTTTTTVPPPTTKP